DTLSGIAAGLVEGGRAGLIHARSTVPALMGAVLSGLFRTPWLFDVRGLLAEEYVDGGHWRQGGLLYRVVNGVERRLLAEADGLIFLTDRIKSELQERRVIDRNIPSAVVPCAADLRVFRPCPEDRERVRKELGIGDAPVLVYVG